MNMAIKNLKTILKLTKMKKETTKQIKLLEKYRVNNYSVDENEKITINSSLDLSSLQSCDKDFLKDITINGWLNLSSLQSCDKDFLKDTTINGSLYLNSLQTCDKDFLKGTTINGSLYLNSLKTCDKDLLKGTTINGSLYLRSLQSCDKDFLKGITINGDLYLRSLQSCDKDFLKGTTINGDLYLNSLQTCDKEILRKNVKQLKLGYNKKGSYCYFDGILSKVITVTEKKGYTIFTTLFEFIVKKGRYTAHGKSVKEAIKDVEFKVIAQKLKKAPIKEDTIINIQYYRTITGACEQGCRSWINQNNIEVTEIKAKDLLPLLEKTNAYGLNEFKKLITW